MNNEVPDEIRILQEGWRLVGNDVQTELLARGWAVTDLNIADDEPLEFFWPPTAPVGYSGLPEPASHEMRVRTHLHKPRQTPRRIPTRITRTNTRWRIVFGEAIGQQPDETVEYAEDAALLANISRIEWWPMTVEEATRIQVQRVFTVTAAAARDDHYQACMVTEPYSSRIDALMAHLRHEAAQQHGMNPQKPPETPRPRGNIGDQLRLINGEAWASAVRTARAGGDSWDTSGRKRSSDPE